MVVVEVMVAVAAMAGRVTVVTATMGRTGATDSAVAAPTVLQVADGGQLAAARRRQQSEPHHTPPTLRPFVAGRAAQQPRPKQEASK